jgi:hypothetical protein
MDAINGSARAPDGCFWMQPDRRFPTDGRAHRSHERLYDLIRRYDKFLS